MCAWAGPVQAAAAFAAGISRRESKERCAGKAESEAQNPFFELFSKTIFYIFSAAYSNFPSFFAGPGPGPRGPGPGQDLGPAKKDGKCFFFKQVFKPLSEIFTIF